MKPSNTAARIIIASVVLALLLGVWPIAQALAETYVVQPGDTLSTIAAQYGVSTSSLASANDISDPSFIYSGQRLTIPGQSSSSPTSTSGGNYVVQPGDTLWQIALRYGVLISSIASANGIDDPSFIWVGQRLSIPGQSTASGGESATPDPAPSTEPSEPAQSAPNAGPGSILANTRVVSYYGNPLAGSMGVLGRYDAGTVIAKLREQIAEYEPLSRKPIKGALEFITPVAQAGPGADGMYRARMSMSLIEEWADIAAQNDLLFILDVQVGRSTVKEEVSVLLPLLERPHVHLALDPEFDMWGSQLPGVEIGHMTAEEINWASQTLSNLVESKNLPNKLLIVHQFTPNMLPDKTSIATNPNVDIVIDMDGFGGQAAKISKYDYVQSIPVQFAGVKLFYREDTDLLAPSQIMDLEPVPDVIIYQ